MCGSFMALVGGFTSEAMEDFTGGIAQHIPSVPPNKLLAVIEESLRMHAFIGCSATNGTG